MKNSKKFIDVKKVWEKSAKHGYGYVVFQNFLLINGIKYQVGDKGVELKPSIREIEVAYMLVNKFGGKIKILPAIKIVPHLKSADYEYKNEKYDLKGIEGKGNTTIYNAIHNKKTQAENFIIDRTEKTPLTRKQIRNQICRLFIEKHTLFVKTIIFVEGKRILNVYQRKK